MAEVTKQRPGAMRLTDALTGYRYPLAAIVSILHRISGGLLVVLLPLTIWLFDTSVTSEVSFDRFRAAFIKGIGILPGWLIKLLVLAILWGYFTHFFVGLRHLWMDVTHAVSRQQGKVSAKITLFLSLLLTLLAALKLFGVY
ncbi:MAG TPA: succinate dehydrogenase, cytochrome b556 subunit [Burkholderiaceae bacterium]|nr:succinate dehydrogenase, cytochrome b556 subunit [Burkholderiaceae bacterium]